MFIDLHAHLPMHLGLPPRHATRRAGDVARSVAFVAANVSLNYRRGRPRATVPLAIQGGVKAIGSAVYTPSGELVGSAAPNPTAYDDVAELLDQVESDLRRENLATLVRNPRALVRTLAAGRLAVFHCVEGSHALAGDPENVRRLADRGVAYLTLAHLFYTGAAGCANPFPHLPERIYRRMNAPDGQSGLSTAGREIVAAMFEEGLVVDVTHCSAAALEDVFAIAARYPQRPVFASHVGVRGTSDSAVNLTDDAIRRIAKSGGVVGVTLSTFRLRAFPGRLTGPRHIGLLFEAIDHIRAISGSYEAVAVGTDLDGFIRPIREFQSYADAPAFARRICERYGPQAAEQILTSNALRVLRLGWTGC